jgi:hypothetical protein
MLEKWWEKMFFVTGSGANVCKMAEKFVFYNRKWYKCGKNGGKKVFLQQEVVQMSEKWYEIVFFATGSSINMGKMTVNNVFVTGSGTNMEKMAVNGVFHNREWCKCCKNCGEKVFFTTGSCKNMGKTAKNIMFRNRKW